jgi:hypothetical protein
MAPTPRSTSRSTQFNFTDDIAAAVREESRRKTGLAAQLGF